MYQDKQQTKPKPVGKRISINVSTGLKSHNSNQSNSPLKVPQPPQPEVPAIVKFERDQNKKAAKLDGLYDLVGKMDAEHFGGD